MLFDQLIKKIKNTGICEDNFIGTVITEKNNIDCANLHFCKQKRLDFMERTEIKEKVNKNNCKNIVIVLESPHKQEFAGSFEGFIAPALGFTGSNLQKQFPSIIKNLVCISKFETYNVIIMNAVQYQCSNGESLKKYRDRTNSIWKYFWKNGCKSDFTTRIESYRPHIIINACTGKIEKRDSIKYLLQESINEYCSESKLYRSPHPSSLWFQPKYISQI